MPSPCKGILTSYSPKCLEKLSEKGYEQRSEREFGQYTAYEMDRKAPLWRPTGLCREHLRSFSDRFVGVFSEVYARKRPERNAPA